VTDDARFLPLHFNTAADRLIVSPKRVVAM
jgi:hypothetical protein